MYVSIQDALCDDRDDFKLMEIKHEGLGLTFDLPDLRQRDVEEYFATLRLRREGRTSARHYGEEITIFVKSLPKLDGERFGLVLREFMTSLNSEQKRGAQLSTPENHGAIVRSAACCGWLGDTTEETVSDMSPPSIKWLASAVDDYIAKSLEIPGE